MRNIPSSVARRSTTSSVNCSSGICVKTPKNRRLDFSGSNGGWRVDGITTMTAQTAERNEKQDRSEEHTSELQSLMRTSYAVFCLKKKNSQILNSMYKT